MVAIDAVSGWVGFDWSVSAPVGDAAHEGGEVMVC